MDVLQLTHLSFHLKIWADDVVLFGETESIVGLRHNVDYDAVAVVALFTTNTLSIWVAGGCNAGQGSGSEREINRKTKTKTKLMISKCCTLIMCFSFSLMPCHISLQIYECVLTSV